MTAVPLGVSSFHRAIAKTPTILLVNMFLEKDASNQVDGLVRIQRPALASFATVGVGPIRGVFRQSGTFSGHYLIVAGQRLYRVTSSGSPTLLGTIAGTSRVSIAATATRALVSIGTLCYSTDGATVTQINMPDDVAVSSVEVINGYFILTQADSDVYWWIAPGETDPDPLSFASAENSPDNIVCVKRLGDELWFFGAESIEVHQPTGDDDLPFQRIEGRLYDKGCANKDSVAAVDNTLFWVGSDGVAYRADTVPVRISDHSIEELISDAGFDALRAWVFTLQGHTFYCLTIGDDQGTFVYDVENQNWAQWKTRQRETWRAHLGTMGPEQTVIAGDDTTGDLWQLDLTQSNDNGELIVRELTGGLPIIGPPQPCYNFSMLVATGRAPLTGNALDAVVEVRWSDDGGFLWSAWRQNPDRQAR
jgi:hypothetical protein